MEKFHISALESPKNLDLQVYKNSEEHVFFDHVKELKGARSLKIENDEQINVNGRSNLLNTNGTPSEQLLYLQNMEVLDSKRRGVIDLITGDTLIRNGGNELLVLKDGGTITVKQDGKFEVDGRLLQPTSHPDEIHSDEIVIELGDDRKVVLREGHIAKVIDNARSSLMMENLDLKIPKIDIVWDAKGHLL